MSREEAAAELAGLLAVMHNANVARMVDLAKVMGANADDPSISALAWAVTLKEASRFLSIGLATKEERTRA